MNSELTQYNQVPESLAVWREPSQVLAEASDAAKALKGLIDAAPNKLTLGGQTYLDFQDWQTMAKFFGCTAKVESSAYVTYGEASGFEASAVALDRNGNVVSRAEAMCLNDEEKWGDRPKYEWEDVLDETGGKIWDKNARQGKGAYKQRKVQIGTVPTPLYQLRSMAQTRACAKVLRQLFGWVVVLAGYNPTPAEEMPDLDTVPNDVSPAVTAETVTTQQQAPGATMNTAPATSNGEPDIRPRSQKGAQHTSQPAENAPSASQDQQRASQAEPVITEKQRKMFFAISRSAGLNDDQVKAALAGIGLNCHRDDIPKNRFQDALRAIDPDCKFHTEQ